ncbi:MAG: thioesterase family protein [Planctomycetota bacterium]
MGEPFCTRRLVEFADTDMAGIAHFSAFFRWMEAAEHAMLRSVGLSIFLSSGGQNGEDDGGDGAAVSFPRVNAACDYRSPARYADELQIAVSVAKLGTKSIAYGFRFSLAGAEIATGQMTSVCCRIVPGQPPRSIAIPEGVADKLRPFATG